MTKQKKRTNPLEAQPDLEVSDQQADQQPPEAQDTAEGQHGQQLEKALAERDEYINLAQRVQADFDNFRRRNAGVRQEAREDGMRDAILPLLPVLDNLERAVDAAKEPSALKDGVDLVLRQLRDALGKQGVGEIDCLGKAFDPECANAVLQAPEAGKEPGTVSEVFQKGYRMGERVLRYAMVKVVAE